MKKRLAILAALPFLLTGCELVHNPGIPVDPPILKDDSYTIMIYMCGSDLESGKDEYGRYSYLATSDLKEIVNTPNKPKNVNIIVETGGAKKWSTQYKISSNKIGRYHVGNNELIEDELLPNANMGKAATFESFLEWGLVNYPAKRTGVILWNHGGAMDGCCFDENYSDDGLEPYELSNAIEAAFTKVKRKEKLEWIGYDACNMAVQDIAEFNSRYFNYMVCSQESEVGEGWDYDKWLDNLYANPKGDTKELLTEICDTFIAENDKELGSRNNDQTLSVLDLNQMDTYKEKWEKMASDLNINSSSKWSSFSKIVNKSKKYGLYDDYTALSYNNGYLFDIFNVSDFLTNMEKASDYSSIKQDFTDLKTALNNLIAYNKTGNAASGSCGLCFFCPLSGYNSASIYTATKTNFSNWRNLVSEYGSFYRDFYR